MTSIYKGWGFKLNLMYSSIPPKYFRNLHNFNEFNAPRIDLGMLSASIYEQGIYGQNTDILPQEADKFYRLLRGEIAGLISQTLLDVKYIKSKNEIELIDGISFVPTDVDVKPERFSMDKVYPIFIIYSANSSEGNSDFTGVPFLRIGIAKLLQNSGNTFNWEYKEIRIGIGEAEHQYKPFILPPLYIAYFKERYSDLSFNYYSNEALDIYKKHTEYFKVSSTEELKYKTLIARETISKLNEYNGYIISWDSKPVDRSIVASQTYYDWDDDIQSNHMDSLLLERIKKIERKE
jgi:hypothetical protein